MRFLRGGLTALVAVCIIAAPFYLGVFPLKKSLSLSADKVLPSGAVVVGGGETQADVVVSSLSTTLRVELPELPPANGYLARVLLDSPEDLQKALLRAEELHARGDVAREDKALAFVLHGPEVQIFFKDNYQRYKPIVDLAAKLSAFNVVDVRVCETRIGLLGKSSENLPPFVQTVPFGPAEIKRLIVEEQYVYF